MEPIKMFGIEHILYILISFIVTTGIIILFIKYIKDYKKQNLIIKIFGGIQILLVVFSRYSLLKYMTPNANFLPYSFCTIVASFLGFLLIITKRDSYFLNGITFLSIISGLLPTIIANYIGQGANYGMNSIFFPCTIISLIDHSWLLMLSLLLLITGYVKFDIKKWSSYLVIFGLISLYSIIYYKVTNSLDVANILVPVITVAGISVDFVCIFILTFLFYLIVSAFFSIYQIQKNKY